MIFTVYGKAYLFIKGDDVQMKATLHLGKQGASKHNDRKFNTEEIGHIHSEKSKDNRYIIFGGDPKLTFEELELEYYKEHYSEELNRINENYKKNRKYKQIKTMEDWLKNDNTKKPEEIILQVGNVEKSIDADLLMVCTKELCEVMYKKYSTNFHLLDLAGHVDEATVHVHLRGVFDYVENGIRKIGTDKALEQLGFERPHPDKKKGRYNNRKQTFTKELRNEWYRILEEHDIDINKNVVPTEHQDLEDYKRQQEQITNNGKKYKKAIEDIIQGLDYDVSDKVITEKDKIKRECAKAIRKGIIDICKGRDLDINIDKEQIKKYGQYENEEASNENMGR